jgi:hypothetical protein
VSSVGAAVGGGLVGWKGLPEEFDEPALRAAVPAEWSSHPHAGARAGSSFTILRAPRAGSAAELEVWIITGQSMITSLEYRPGAELDNAAILADLGAPEHVLDSRHLVTGAVVRDHVHASRGITVSVAQPYEPESAPSDPYIIFVQLYAPTSIQGYVTRVGQSGAEIRPYPR